jgi:NitT/TauT family transport system substrate-binding protein
MFYFLRTFRYTFFVGILFVLTGHSSQAAAADRPQFTVGWSIYVGWNPYQYMVKSGILKKWEDKYGVSIRVQRFDYAPSLDAFVSKNIDACTMTNMEALDMPAASGVDSTAIIVGDYSNGNDAVLVRNNLPFQQLAGKRVLLVQKTVSEYLLERGLAINNVKNGAKSLRLVNTADSDIVTAFSSDTGNQAVVTWKPLISQVREEKGVTTLFDSSKIPGEILDLLVVRTDVLKTPDGAKFAKAITGAWYEVMAQLSSGGPKAEAAMKGIASVSGDTLASFKEQLSTTHLYSKPADAASFTASKELQAKMDLVRQFCFQHGLLGQRATSADDVAIQYPDGSIQGKKDRVKLRFDASYMRIAREGKL